MNDEHAALIEVFKTLSNPHRWQILLWLQAPQQHFAELAAQSEREPHPDADEYDICVGAIASKSGLAQSVVSGYLAALKNAGLVRSRRLGQWTYYRYDPEGAAQFMQRLHAAFQHTRKT